MDSKKILEKYYSRLAREGIIKALICGIIIGFGVDFVFAILAWALSAFNKWLFLVAILVGAAIGVGAAFLLYYKKFKPTTKQVAERLDSMGLDERLITMLEYSGDESEMANYQREDAQIKLSKVPSTAIKLVFAKTLIIMASVIGVLGLAMTTVSALSGFGKMPKLADVVNPPNDFEGIVFVSYYVEGDGYIIGGEDQEVAIGGDANPVMAVANDGWVFIGWDDGYGGIQRQDLNIQQDCFFTAMFDMIPDAGSDEGNDQSQLGGEASDQPTQSDPNTMEPDPDGDPPEQDENKRKPTGKYSPSNQFKDGKTPYQEEFDAYYAKFIEEMLASDDLSPEERAMYEFYYSQLKSSGEQIETETTPEEPETP